MIHDAKQFDKIEYVIEDQKIGYKEHDGVSFSIVYGYKTMFAYFYESELHRGNISK